ncbi:MAG: hypothetical protein JW863_09595 [Chitinispirillaceae bacterium]|nr:hypothetical protein [Chitinispirillaceae bacterium]
MRLQAILLSIPLVLLWYAAGYRTLQITGFICKKRSDLLIATMLGFGITGNILTILGFIQQLSPPVILSVLLLILLSGMTRPYLLLFSLIRIDIRPLRQPYWIGILVFTGLYSIRALLPPTGIDGLMYHLTVPKLFLEHSGFHAIPWIRHSDLPMLGEMVFLIGIVFKNPILCRQIAWITGLFLCGAILLISTAMTGNRRYVPLSLLLFLSHTVTTANMTLCNVDMLTAAFTLSSFYLLKKSVDNNGSLRKYLPALLLLCFTVESKPFGILIIPLAGLYLAVFIYKKGSFRWDIIALAVIAPVAAGLIWYMKSWYLSGIPISGITTWKASSAAVAADQAGTIAMLWNKFLFIAGNFISAPWSYSLAPYVHRMDNFGPLFIGCIPFALFTKRNSWFNHGLLWATGIWLFFIALSTARGFHGNLSIRYMTAAVALFAIATVYTYAAMNTSHIRSFIGFCFVFWVAVSFTVSVKRYRNDIRSVVTLQPPHDYLMENYDLYPVINYINSRLPQSCNVKTAFGFGTFYIDRPFTCAHRRFTDPAIMLQTYKNEGVTHLLANNILRREDNNYEWLSGTSMKLLYHANGYYLYELP